MIIKFDGVDGCGKSTLSKAVAEQLSSRNYTVAQVSEFSSPVNYAAGSTHAATIDSMRIREAALNPAFDCDDVERQLLLHFLSRRRNRVEIPHLDRLCDFVVVDRSTFSNYAYAEAVDPRLTALSDIAIGSMESADVIFWIDTPIAVCMARIADRPIDAVEQKGRAYFDRVHEIFRSRLGGYPAVRVLDGSREIGDLVGQVLSVVEGRSVT
jgi:thymidylate kinase